jgi:hypothetical protein
MGQREGVCGFGWATWSRSGSAWFANSDGAATEQTIYELGGGIMAVAVGEGRPSSDPTRPRLVASRSPQAGGGTPGGSPAMPSGGRRCRRTAPSSPALSGTHAHPGGDQVALQCTILRSSYRIDRVYGTEQAYANLPPHPGEAGKLPLWIMPSI